MLSGHSAPAPDVSLSARTPARNPSPAKSKLRSSPIGLGGDIGMLSDGQSVLNDSINIDMLLVEEDEEEFFFGIIEQLPKRTTKAVYYISFFLRTCFTKHQRSSHDVSAGNQAHDR